MYGCGITVYDEAHIGHASQAIFFDVIRNYLEYSGYDFIYVRNFTDIEDKIIAKSHETGTPPLEISAHYIEDTRRDLAAIKVKPATFEPKVTEHVDDIVEFVRQLVEKGHAYISDGDVYFDVTTPRDYGKLSNRTLDEANDSNDEAEEGTGKRRPADFTLWKSSKLGEPSWPSPWGDGRPGWHIECSVMARKFLGDTLDVHGGGMDLVFPHHENEIAQTESLTGKPMARYWIHNGLVMVENKKMSKSLGNFFTIKQALAEYPADVIRYLVLSHHYSSNIDFSGQSFRNAEKRVLYFYRTLRRVNEYLYSLPDTSPVAPDEEMVSAFETSMNDNFNTAEVIGNLSRSFARANDAVMNTNTKAKDEESRVFLPAFSAAVELIAKVFGMFDEDPEMIVQDVTNRVLKRTAIDETQIEALIDERSAARREKSFDRADAIRDQLRGAGITLLDRPDGTSEWEVSID
jgi:cysteinyl-tRNA synthetase